ncbi:hypothetical protein VTO58DRAFT_102079 [Aureobasidium pullulans]
MTEARARSLLRHVRRYPDILEWYKKIIMPYNLNCSSMDLVLSHTSSTTYPTGVLANGDTGKDPGYIVLNNGDTGKDPGARETGNEQSNVFFFACCGDRTTTMA